MGSHLTVRTSLSLLLAQILLVSFGVPVSAGTTVAAGRPAAGTTGAEIPAAVARGTSYLKSVVARDDYRLTCRASDGSVCPVDAVGHVFAAFFIADSVGDKLSADERQKLLDRMGSENRQGAWGYTPYAPVDSDDTAFVIRAYRLLGRKVSIAELARFYDKAGRAFTTFHGEGAPVLTHVPSEAGNSGFHPEVNANVFGALAGTNLARLIDEDVVLRSQDPEGFFRTYFYPGKYYGTLIALDFLCKTGRGEDARKKGVAFLTASQNRDGSWGRPAGAYETSLALCGLGACKAFGDSFHKGVSWLLRQQKADGSFREEETVVWQYTYQDNPSVVWRAFDTSGVVTTALALRALRSVQRAGGGR